MAYFISFPFHSGFYYSPKLMLFVISKDEWNTKEDTDKSLKNVQQHVYCGVPKGTSWAEAMSYSENIKPVALSTIKLRWSEGIRQLVNQ